MKRSGPTKGELDHALDAALARSLTPPEVPAQFRTKLEAVLARADDESLLELRKRLEREQRQRLAELEQDYVRLRRRTLGTMIGGAFAAGAASALALPWFSATLGPMGPVAIASVGSALGIAIGIHSWMASRGDTDTRARG